MTMQAIILAAGVGRRLASVDEKLPKCLLAFDGKSLLARHIENLQRCGVDRVLVVVGHLADLIEQELEHLDGRIEIRQVVNPDYRRGSLLSLKVGLAAVARDRPVLIMDADVLYHPDVLRRLVEAPFENGFLLDPRAEAAGEEMMLGATDERVWTISRGAGRDYPVLGEGVGFFKLAAHDIGVLLEEIDRLVAAGRLDADYENAIDAFLKRRPAFFVSVADLPWTEIDFDEDVEQARLVILPAIEGVAGRGAAKSVGSEPIKS
ncbi:MAG: phosphocholine cytidylyltransferase family protein [Bradymonadales bacterium]|nr:phosphocholine cytidylyltransferase family protein [Bradymonadales bacterium]